MTVYERIDSILQKNGLSRRQAAKMAHIPPSTFQSVMERQRHISIEMLAAISEALEIPFGELLEETDFLTVGDELMAGKKKNDDLHTAEELFERYKKDGSRDFLLAASGMLEKMHKDSLHAEMIYAFNNLNETGQEIAVQRVKELGKIPEYQSEREPGDDGR